MMDVTTSAFFGGAQFLGLSHDNTYFNKSLVSTNFTIRANFLKSKLRNLLMATIGTAGISLT
jgi:hypothetical protein